MVSSKNVIFICVFFQTKFLEMFIIMLYSIRKYGKLNNNTDILVYTSSEFMNIIKKHQLYYDNIKFVINDNYNTVRQAALSRLDMFKFNIINDYNKILYLDTDIIVKGDLNKVFDVITKDVIYAVEEGTITNDSNIYGGELLFGSDLEKYLGKPAFSSGIMGFTNSETIRELYKNINKDLSIRPYNLSCMDQPYIVYNCFKYDLFDNQIFNQLCVNNDNNIYSDKVIHHFPGGVGVYQHKMFKMINFIKELDSI